MRWPSRPPIVTTAGSLTHPYDHHHHHLCRASIQVTAGFYLLFVLLVSNHPSTVLSFIFLELPAPPDPQECLEQEVWALETKRKDKDGMKLGGMSKTPEDRIQKDLTNWIDEQNPMR
ncbi:uncharacterized protein LOC110218798 [Phascolarctos cinereus]